MKIFRPPVFENEEQTRRASLLHFMLWTLLVCASVYALLIPIFLPERISRLPVSLSMVVLAITLLFILNRGKVMPAGVMLTLGLWLILTAGNWTAGGVHNPNFMAYIIVIMVAGLTLSGRAAIVYTGMSILIGLLMVYAEESGILPPGNRRVDTTAIWLSDSAYFVAAGVLLYLAARSITGALDRAQYDESALAVRNLELVHQIQERSQLEEAYRLLVENSLQGLLIFQAGRIVFANPAVTGMMGYTLDELMALEDTSVLIYPDDRNMVGNFIASRLQGKPAPSRYEFRFIHKSGEVKWIEIFATRITYQGKPAIQTTTIDITARKQAEEKLRESEERYRGLAENSAVGIWQIDMEDNTVYLNPTMCSFLGIKSPKEIAGKPMTGFFAAESQATLEQQRQLRLRGLAGTYEVELLNPKGEKRAVLVSGVPLFHEGGILYGRVATFVDITERKQAERQRLELILQRERIELLTEFIGTISHDLKTPLSVINTSLYLLEHLTDPEKQKNKLHIIKEQTERLEQLIQNILTITRLDHAPHFSIEPVNLVRLISEVGEKLRPAAERKNLEFISGAADDVPPVSGDVNELYRMLENLLENAITYTTAEGTVRTSISHRDGSILIEVSDTGVGIDEEELPYIFERFYRTDKARNMSKGGTGLGLAIVKKIVELHRGQLEVESSPGKGTTFRVRLPVLIS